MAYIGVQPQDTFISIDKQTFSTSATATYTLDHTVGSVNDIALFLNNVRQEPTSAYTISGTTLTLASAITSSDSMYCIYLGKSIGTQAPATGSVTNDMLAGSIANAKLSGPLGKIGQVVHGSTSTAVNVTTSTFTDTGLTASITPTSTSSKVLIIISQTLVTDRDSEYGRSRFRILRDGSGLANAEWNRLMWVEAGGVSSVKNGGLVATNYLDTPSSTSSLTYKTQGAAETTTNNGTARFQQNSESSFITLMEVLA